MTMALYQQAIQVSPIHPCLMSILARFVNMAESLGDLPNEASVVEESVIFDFDVEFKVKLTLVNKRNQTVLETSIPGWHGPTSQVSRRLKEIYGDAVTFVSRAHENSTFQFSVNVEQSQSKFASKKLCIESLSRLRIQAIGSPILSSLERILSCPSPSRDTKGELIYKVVSPPRYGICHCHSDAEKLMVIFTVDLEDETERALARLFLQQFQVAQKNVSQSPHCEFRRPNEPPKEALAHAPKEWKNLIGYMSFTFFPTHVKTRERRLKAVEMMVNFIPYLDKHVKSTKSYIHSRMRSKKGELLRELEEQFSKVKKQAPVRRHCAASGKSYTRQIRSHH